jgi:hypothetical protein
VEFLPDSGEIFKPVTLQLAPARRDFPGPVRITFVMCTMDVTYFTRRKGATRRNSRLPLRGRFLPDFGPISVGPLFAQPAYIGGGRCFSVVIRPEADIVIRCRNWPDTATQDAASQRAILG